MIPFPSLTHPPPGFSPNPCLQYIRAWNLESPSKPSSSPLPHPFHLLYLPDTFISTETIPLLLSYCTTLDTGHSASFVSFTSALFPKGLFLPCLWKSNGSPWPMILLNSFSRTAVVYSPPSFFPLALDPSYLPDITNCSFPKITVSITCCCSCYFLSMKSSFLMINIESWIKSCPCLENLFVSNI